MDKKTLENIIIETLDHLKDFQTKTVEVVYNKLYNENRKKHLVADEVGLGKTIVAKGLIAKVLSDHIKINKPLRVVYICSNQALAAQNLMKLNILRDSEDSSISIDRLIFQVYKNDNSKAFQLKSLTPSTSFRLKLGTGIQKERMLIYSILSEYKVFSKGRRNNGLKLTLIGNVEDPHNWKRLCDSFKEKYSKRIRGAVYSKFKREVKNTLVDSNEYKEVYSDLKLNTPHKLQDILIKYSELLDVRNAKKYWGKNRLLSLLRRILTEISLEYIDADLYILDEFQKFKDLIETEGKDFAELTEAAAIAKKIFDKKESKVLMLSATPFKQYTTRYEDENEEEHFKEFKTVLRFLIANDSELERFTEHRSKFFDLLRRPEQIEFGNEKELNNQLLSKVELENIYRKVISRTERLTVSDDKNTLIRYKGKDDKKQSLLNLKKEDIKDFITADSLMQSLSDNTDGKIRNILGYVLSSPYPFSYLDKYKVKENLSNNKENPEIRKAIIKSKSGWLDWKKIQGYKSFDIPNGKLRYLISETIESGLWKQLWITPSLPYYNPKGAFTGSNNSSKILLFSKWVMVPKMIASLLSYETERRTIGDQKALHRNEEPRVYSPPEVNNKRKPRRPTKILSLQMKNEKPAKMSAFTMLYPSLTIVLDKDLHPVKNIKIKEPLQLIQLKEKYKTRFEHLIEKANLKRYCSHNQKTKNWYWTALPLLDKEFYPKKTRECLSAVNENSSDFMKTKKTPDAEEDYEYGANGNHFLELVNLFESPENFKLGQMPDNLCEVLADIALGSPAVCYFRTVLQLFPEETLSEKFTAGLDIASEFQSLFDKPEAISLIQLTSIQNRRHRKVNNRVYWLDTINYCVDGNLQSVLDEYGHLIYSDNKNIYDFNKRFSNTININTTSVTVDSAESFLSGKSERMRCHFAVDFGNQKMDKAEGLNRITSVLNNFNSPFRPFVLASTSIGQEGLDFHYYCRKLVHWNLPSNPIDFEQREGRINRFKGLVIRQNIAKKYHKLLSEDVDDIWETMFKKAREIEGEGENSKPELVPYWHVESDDIFIERIVPLLPYSKEVSQLKNLLATLTLYRLTFGQPRQEELVETLFKELSEEEIEIIRENFMIDLSPISYS